ncbi:MAG TPA: aldo/keto reductase [Telluria sp.]|jgi:voltage-dependent potassium channel beta subunit
MEYRRLGQSGLRVSVLAYGTWVTFAEQGELSNAIESLTVARQAGVNLFDTADAYGHGQAEILLGRALEQLGWDRATYVLSTKVYSGLRNCVNMCQTLNRKYLLQAIDESLERLRTPFVDLLYCHRPDPATPVEETVWAMSDIVAAGKAHYWGTSGWSVEQIRQAWECAERYRLRKPSMEQTEYNLFKRASLEGAYATRLSEMGVGIATWSPLAAGLLSGKYRNAIPRGSRACLPGYDWLKTWLVDEERNSQVRELEAVAHALGATPAQLAIAWCTTNPALSSVILGASSAAQLRDNLRAIEVVPLLTAEVMRRIDRIFPYEN